MYILTHALAQLAGTIEYTDCISALSSQVIKCPRYNTKQFDGEAPVILELWGMRNTLSLPLLPGSLWPGVVASIDQTKMFDI